MTVWVLTCKTRAVSRIPLAFRAISTICRFTVRRLPSVGIVQEEGATRTALLAAAVPLLALTGLAMANNIRALTVGTVQNLDDHDATQSRWGYSSFKDAQRG